LRILEKKLSSARAELGATRCHWLDAALDLLQKHRRDGLFRAIEDGVLAGVKRPFEGGKGLSGVVVKEDRYFNPFIALLQEESKTGSERYQTRQSSA
jgi:hypothetical protein